MRSLSHLHLIVVGDVWIYYLATCAQSVPSLPVPLVFAAPPISWLGDPPDTLYENCFVCTVPFAFIFLMFSWEWLLFICFKRLNQFWLLCLDENQKALIIHVFSILPWAHSGFSLFSDDHDIYKNDHEICSYWNKCP